MISKAKFINSRFIESYFVLEGCTSFSDKNLAVSHLPLEALPAVQK